MEPLVTEVVTEATEVVNEVIEVVDYTPMLEVIEAYAGQIADASVLISGFMLFIVVVILCYFAYRFFRIFF